MANIDSKLQAILDAVYGEEVRGSIHDAIEAMNIESSTAYTAAIESQESAANSAAAAKTSEINAKTSETNAKSSETKAKTSETNAKTSETNAKTSETNAKTSEIEAKSARTSAQTSAQTSEAWAVGTRNGYAVTSTDKTYQNNSKWYAQQAGQDAAAANTSANTASTMLDEIESRISDAFDGRVPKAWVDYTTGNLMWEGGEMFIFTLDEANGTINWAVA